MSNYNLQTGIRFGVISGNSLDSDTLNDLFYGSGAVNLSEQDALAEVRAQFEREADDLEGDIEIEASEVDPNMSEFDRLGFVEGRLAAAYEVKGYADREDFIKCGLVRETEYLCIEEPVIEGIYKGVTYRISWLGGAIIVFIFESPVISKARLCSPCVPGAGNLDNLDEDGEECYGVPRDWRQA